MKAKLKTHLKLPKPIVQPAKSKSFNLLRFLRQVLAYYGFSRPLCYDDTKYLNWYLQLKLTTVLS